MDIINKSSHGYQFIFFTLLSTVVFFNLTTAQIKTSVFAYNATASDNTSDDDWNNVQKLVTRDYRPVLTLEPEPIIHPCDDLLRRTSDAFAEFYRCTVSSARPYRFCEDCSRVYMKAISVYHEIQMSAHNSSIFNCNKYLLASDNSPVIPSAMANILTIWREAYCDNCFENSVGTSDTNNTNLSNSTLRFLLLYQNLTDCISESILHDQPVNICRSCHDLYRALNNHFNEIEQISSSTVCMDIMDRMNYTRIQWSKDFNCSTTRPRYTVFISSIIIASITVPTMYYVGAYIASRGAAIVRDKIIKNHNAQQRRNRRHSSYDSIDETHGINSPSVSSSSQT